MNQTATDNRVVQIKAGGTTLEGVLTIPDSPTGLVIFVHGSGSSRSSPRNQFVAQMLNKGSLATLLFDLLTPEEEIIDMKTHQIRFDIDLLSQRVLNTTRWLIEQPVVENLPVGYFGASTGAAAALVAASMQPDTVRAVVSRGGRPDLAGMALPHVRAAVLLIAGSLDAPVIDLNQQALEQMSPRAEKRLVVINGAAHLFEEDNTLEQAGRLACDWFKHYLNFEL